MSVYHVGKALWGLAGREGDRHDEDLAADRLPDLKVLRARFAPDLASLPEVTVHLTPLTAYEALNDSYIGEAA